MTEREFNQRLLDIYLHGINTIALAEYYASKPRKSVEQFFTEHPASVVEDKNRA